MKLIKCHRCGRPYYDSSAECPYCNDAVQSTSDITKQPEVDAPEIVIPDNTMDTIIEPCEEPFVEPNVMPVHKRPVQQYEEAAESKTASGRAEAMANLAENVKVIEDSNFSSIPGEADTTPLPRKRHGWVWIVVIVILVILALAIYLKWDYVNNLITSIIK